MAVKVFVRRHCKEGRVENAIDMLDAFRKAAREQAGYLSSETLVNHYDPRCILVVSSWQSLEGWIRWQNSSERDRNEARIEGLLDRPTVYEIFDVSGGSG